MSTPESVPELVPAAVLEVLDRAGVPVAQLDAGGRVRVLNAAFALACGRPAGELAGTSLADVGLDDDLTGLADALAATTSTLGEVVGIDLRVIGADGRVRPLRLHLGGLATPDTPDPADAQELPRVLCVAHDLSHERRRDRSERRARLAESRASTTDPSTGLPNRRGLELTLASAARRAGREGGAFAVLRCELSMPSEKFDDPGNKVLAAGAAACLERLRQRLRSADTATSLDDGVLVVVAEDLDDEQDAAGVAYRLLSTVVEPVPTAGAAVRLDMTIGIAMADGSTPPNALLAAADQATTEALDSARGGFRIVDLRGLDAI